MFLFDWLFSLLSLFGLDFRTPGKVLFLGLDNAGKTSLLYRLKNDKMVTLQSTQYPNQEELSIGNVRFMTIDLGGHEIARRIWDNYYTSDVTAIVYLVDTSAPERFQLSSRELHNLLQNDMINKVPILILGNKIDKGVTVDENGLKERLDIAELCTGKKNFDVKGRPMEVFMCSVKEETGYGEGILWLSNFMNK